MYTEIKAKQNKKNIIKMQIILTYPDQNLNYRRLNQYKNELKNKIKG